MKRVVLIIVAGIGVAGLLMGFDWLLANPASIGMLILAGVAGAGAAELVNWVQKGRKGEGQ